MCYIVYIKWYRSVNMPAVASIEDLKAASLDVDKFRKEHGEAAVALVYLLDRHKMIGYKNIAKMFAGKTPEEIKA